MKVRAVDEYRSPFRAARIIDIPPSAAVIGLRSGRKDLRERPRVICPTPVSPALSGLFRAAPSPSVCGAALPPPGIQFSPRSSVQKKSLAASLPTRTLRVISELAPWRGAKPQARSDFFVLCLVPCESWRSKAFLMASPRQYIVAGRLRAIRNLSLRVKFSLRRARLDDELLSCASSERKTSVKNFLVNTKIRKGKEGIDRNNRHRRIASNHN